LGPLAVAEHGEKLCVRRGHHRHPHQPTEHGGHQPAPPELLQTHPCVLPPVSFSSRSHPRKAGGGRPAQYTDTSITVNSCALLCAFGTEPRASIAPGS